MSIAHTVWRLALLGMLLLASATNVCVADDDKAPDADEAKVLAREYIKPDTTVARREEILAKLQQASRKDVNATIAVSLTADDKRAAALELAIALKVRGLFGTAKKYIDGKEEVLIVKLGAATKDKGAFAFLHERWAKADPASDPFKNVQAVFEETWLDIETIDKLKGALKDKNEARVKGAARILKYQFRLDTDDPKVILEKWAKSHEMYATYGKAFDITGDDLLADASNMETAETKPYADNIVVNEKGKIRIKRLPRWGDHAGFQLKLRVYVLSGSGLEVEPAYARGQFMSGGYRLKIVNDDWACSKRDQLQNTLPLKRNAWTEVIFQAKLENDAGDGASRTLTVFIDGKPINKADQTEFNGKLVDFNIRAGDCKLVVGGVEMVPFG